MTANKTQQLRVTMPVSTESNPKLMAQLTQLSDVAWTVREKAYVIGPTKVGCALLAGDGSIHAGCNVEHRYRSHDVHAEVNAITTMVATGQRTIELILIAAERSHFTPCGACMDWILQFASESCTVAFQNGRDGAFTAYSARELMPYYPS